MPTTQPTTKKKPSKKKVSSHGRFFPSELFGGLTKKKKIVDSTRPRPIEKEISGKTKEKNEIFQHLI